MNQAGIRNLAERINRNFSTSRFMSGDTGVPVTISVGVGAPDILRNTRFEELLTIADQRLTQAVSQGGNRIVYEDISPEPAPEVPEAVLPEPELVEADAAESVFPAGIELEDLEEIDLSHVGLPGSVPETDTYNVQTIEALAPGTAEPAGDRFAGPVPDSPGGLTTPVTPDHAATVDAQRPESHPTVPANEPVELPAEVAADDILISAPYSAHTTPAPDAGATTDKPETAGSRDDTPDTDAGADGAAADDPDSTPRRKGFFRKILGLFGLFRSRR